MVNTGRPSKGCLTCRRRRVKCDEARPSCRRCTKLQAECAWQDEWSSMVRRQEQWAQKKVDQRVERVQLLRSERTRPESFQSSVPQQFPNAVMFAMQPQISPQIFALDQFYRDYTFAAATCPFLYRVESLYMSTRTGCLQSAVPAVALASTAKQLHRYDLMQEATQHYGKALRKLAQSIADPYLAKTDATLLTVFLLGHYEQISIDKVPGMRPPWEVHGTGRLAILRLRGEEQLQTQSGRNLFMVMYLEHLIASFCGSSELIDECAAWIRRSIPESPIRSIMLIMHDVSIFIKKLKKALHQKRPKTKRILRLLQLGIAWHKMIDDLYSVLQFGEAHDSITMKFYAGPVPSKEFPESSVFRTDLKECTEKIRQNGISAEDPPGRQPTESSGTDPPGTDTDPLITDEVKMYTSVTRAIAANNLRATHIHLMHALIEAIPYIEPSNAPSLKHDIDTDTLLKGWNSLVERFAEDICHDVPYAVGNVDHLGRKVKEPLGGSGFRSSLSLWPMQTALDAPQTSPLYKRLIAKRLRHIGHGVGIGMALYLLSKESSALVNAPDRDNEPLDEPYRAPPSMLGVDPALNDHLGKWCICCGAVEDDICRTSPEDRRRVRTAFNSTLSSAILNNPSSSLHKKLDTERQDLRFDSRHTSPESQGYSYTPPGSGYSPISKSVINHSHGTQWALAINLTGVSPEDAATFRMMGAAKEWIRAGSS